MELTSRDEDLVEARKSPARALEEERTFLEMERSVYAGFAANGFEREPLRGKVGEVQSNSRFFSRFCPVGVVSLCLFPCETA